MEDALHPILRVKDLVKVYGSRRVVDGVSFYVDKGEVVGLLGPNGAGKTTCFRMTCGMVEPAAGCVLLDNIDVTRWPMYKRARDGGMGYLAQESSVFRKLSVEQNLMGMLELVGFDRSRRKARCEELLEQFKITHIRKTNAWRISGGEKRRLEIARCLISEPKIILLDEPFAGIDPVTVQNIQTVIRELTQRNNISILITDHAARETLQITDRSYVISEGKVLCHGPPTEVIQHPEARAKYFGDIDPASANLGGSRTSNNTSNTFSSSTVSRDSRADAVEEESVPQPHLLSRGKKALSMLLPNREAKRDS